MKKEKEKSYYLVVKENIGKIILIDIIIFVLAAIINLIPPIYDRIQDSFNLKDITSISILVALFIINAAFFSVFWGYKIDKIDRIKVLNYSLIIAVIGLMICAFATTFPVFAFGLMLSSLAYGAQMPATYSIISDIIPSRYWALFYGNVAVLISVSKVAGNFLSGFIGPLNILNMGWQFPFIILTIISIIALIILIPTKFPNKGASAIEQFNKELSEKIKEGNISYGFTIDKKEFKLLAKKKTNRNILWSGFFYVLPGAALEGFLIFYLIDGPFSSFPAEIRTQISQLFAAVAGLGYLIGTFFLGTLFDKLRRRSAKKRCITVTLSLFITIPLLIGGLCLLKPVDYSTLNLQANYIGRELKFSTYYEIISEIFRNYPVYIGYLILMTLASLFASPVAINRSPVMLDVNNPEHSGTSQSILNLSDQIGRGVSYLFIAFQYIILNWFFDNINWHLLLILSALFYLPATYFWSKICRCIDKDIEEKEQKLLKNLSYIEKKHVFGKACDN